MLKGKNAIVTGATSGIGLAIAKALAAQGCNLMFNGLGDSREIENLRRGIAEDFGVKANYHDADLSKPEEIPALIKAAEDAFGHLDILINNAGIQYLSPIETFPTERWDAIMAINLSAPFHTIRAALPGMKRQGWGRIVNIASVNGLVGSTHRAAYVAAKHGLVGLMRALSADHLAQPVTFNALCPAYVDTDIAAQNVTRVMQRDGLDREAATALVQSANPHGRLIPPEDIARAALWLCGPGSDSIDGQAIQISGGEF